MTPFLSEIVLGADDVIRPRRRGTLGCELSVEVIEPRLQVRDRVRLLIDGALQLGDLPCVRLESFRLAPTVSL